VHPPSQKEGQGSSIHSAMVVQVAANAKAEELLVVEARKKAMAELVGTPGAAKPGNRRGRSSLERYVVLPKLSCQ
jgi:hypothetical protein